MGFNQTAQLALATLSFGILAFIFGVAAELNKPATGTAIQAKDVVICKFPKDPSVAFGALSSVSVFISALVGMLAVSFPYEGKSVPRSALLASPTMKTFFYGAILLTLGGAGSTLLNTISEGLIHVRNTHEDLDYSCPTAKTGLFGGAAFLSLDASLFWLVCQMLVGNAREDYFGYDEDESKGEFSQIASS